MDKLKHNILLITGPGVILFETVVLFLHLFTPLNTRAWLVGGLLVFFVVFIPFYSIEYFRQEFKEEKDSKVRFRKKTKRMEWGGGNVHGTTPKETDGPGKLF